MIFTYEATLHCDTPECGKMVAGDVGMDSTEAALNATSEAGRQGWRFLNALTPLCPTCAAKLTEQGK